MSWIPRGLLSDKLTQNAFISNTYDPDAFELIPASEPKPESHGLGNTARGSCTAEHDSGAGYPVGKPGREKMNCPFCNNLMIADIVQSR